MRHLQVSLAWKGLKWDTSASPSGKKTWGNIQTSGLGNLGQIKWILSSSTLRGSLRQTTTKGLLFSAGRSSTGTVRYSPGHEFRLVLCLRWRGKWVCIIVFIIYALYVHECKGTSTVLYSLLRLKALVTEDKRLKVTQDSCRIYYNSPNKYYYSGTVYAVAY